MMSRTLYESYVLSFQIEGVLINYSKFMSKHLPRVNKWDILRDLVSFVQFKKPRNTYEWV